MPPGGFVGRAGGGAAGGTGPVSGAPGRGPADQAASGTGCHGCAAGGGVPWYWAGDCPPVPGYPAVTGAGPDGKAPGETWLPSPAGQTGPSATVGAGPEGPPTVGGAGAGKPPEPGASNRP